MTIRTWELARFPPTNPRSSNGKELFYHTLDNKLMVAEYAASGDSFNAGGAAAMGTRSIHSPGGTVPSCF